MNILEIDTVSLDEKTKELVIIDQTKLPNDIELIRISDKETLYNAIKLLQVRGAPAIGVAAAIGMYAIASRLEVDDISDFKSEYKRISDYINSSRPTAVNLSWALNRMYDTIADISSDVNSLKEILHNEACKIRDEDIAVCEKLGEYGLSLIKDGDGILTHCNAGQLATVRYGTALAPIHLGLRKGMHFKVFTDETRPLLQGARLSAFEMCSAGADTTVICDNMASSVMKNGWVNAVFVGADRIAANGDVANKIGTSGVAVLAKYYNIPFYVVAPTSTIDMNCPDGKHIKIEQRNEDEVTSMWYKKRMAPEGVKVFNPAFDVTENSLVTAIITEKGIIKKPSEIF
ncbi:MAG: S-methyl-5-thioribose-1-phosphate isomerase [Clostridiales bacterium]|nr:S-methyl-5-thioribose-1-phosphate isomerase [Clostridiales bacterium]